MEFFFFVSSFDIHSVAKFARAGRFGVRSRSRVALPRPHRLEKSKLDLWLADANTSLPDSFLAFT